MSKVYTRGGDKGTTCIFGLGRVSKADPLIDLIGHVDELQVAVGLLIAHIKESDFKDLDELDFLKSTQLRLLEMGSILASPKKDSMFGGKDSDIESRIDAITMNLPPLKEFILAGSNLSEAQAHVCRVICRRVERKLWLYSSDPDDLKSIKKFLNRFSDYFFTLARYLATEETRYKISKKRVTNIDM